MSLILAFVIFGAIFVWGVIGVATESAGAWIAVAVGLLGIGFRFFRSMIYRRAIRQRAEQERAGLIPVSLDSIPVDVRLRRFRTLFLVQLGVFAAFGIAGATVAIVGWDTEVLRFLGLTFVFTFVVLSLTIGIAYSRGRSVILAGAKSPTPNP